MGLAIYHHPSKGISMSHHACGKRGKPHGPHRFRRFLWGMGAVYTTHCEGE